MRLLLDNNIPQRLKRLLPYNVESAFEKGWARLVNGELLKQAEAAGFNCLLTGDQNLPYQNSLRGRNIAVVVVNSTKPDILTQQIQSVIEALERARAGEVTRVTLDIPRRRQQSQPEPER